jgi:tetratricopeptide (TPR) repeat protein
MRIALVITLACALVVPAARAGAQNAPPDESARPLFEAGRRAYEQGHYAEALDAFQRVFVLTGHPTMLVNIGNAHAKLGDRKRAAAAFEQYLALVPDSNDRLLLEARIAELERDPEQELLPPPPPPVPPRAASNGGARTSPGLFAGRTFTWGPCCGSTATSASTGSPSPAARAVRAATRSSRASRAA